MADGFNVSFGFDPVGLVLGGLQTLNDFQRQEYERQADERNFEYQKQLQNTIFHREDNALQRRMADAQAAGLNPFDAAGSGGAGAGAVVSKNSTPSLPSLGGLVDQYAAIKRLPLEMKELQAGAKKAEAEARMAQSAANAQHFQDVLNEASVLMSFGLGGSINAEEYGSGKLRLKLTGEPTTVKLGDTPYGQNYVNQNYLNYGKAKELEKVLQYYDVSEIGGMLMPLVKLLLGR